MIKIIKIKKHYRLCQSCGCDNYKKDLYQISIGFDSTQTSSFVLCSDCFNLLKEQKDEKN